MLQTYTGTLSDGQITWDTVPPEGDGVRVTVTIQEPKAEDQGRGARMAAILDKLAASDIHKHFPDPLEWQREIRKDRPLPGREED
jgi:hypothetical protein